jgi:Carboxypeptidase regulatory-like domain
VLTHAFFWVLATLPAQPDSTGVLSMLVTSRDDGQALPYGTIAIQPIGLTRFTDESGHLTVRRLAPGQYALQAREIGFAPADTTVTVHAGEQQAVTIALSRVAIRLARIMVKGRRSKDCIGTGLPDYTGDPDVAEVFRQLRTSIDRARLLSEQYPLMYSLERVMVMRAPGAPDKVVLRDTTYFDERRDYYEPGKVVYFEVEHGVKTQMARLINFADLGDSLFQQNHCFDYGGNPKVDGQRMIQIDFRAAKWLRQPDIEGSIFLDADRFVVRRAAFHLTHPERANPPIGEFGVMTTFREVAPLITLFETVDTDQPLGATRAMEHDRLLKFLYVQRSPGQ